MRLTTICVALLVAASGTVSAEPSPSWHEDDRFGYAIKPPAKWTQIPIRAGEDWLVAKYLSDRTYFWTDDVEGWTWEHQPEMMVVAFMDDELRKQLQDAQSGDDDGEVKVKTKPYKDYEDYLDRTYAGGGFYIDGKEEDEHKGVKVTQYSIKVEKLVQSGPKRIITWVYHTDGIDLAVQYEVLEDEYKKLERTLESSLKSFKVIERTLGGLTGEASTLPFYISIESMNEGTPEERKVKRIQSQQQLHDQAITGLADDWSYEYMGSFLVLNHSDDRYAKRAAEHGEAVLAWLEETFPFVGPKEYVRTPILRICKDRDEENSFARGRSAGGWGWYSSGLEIVTHKDDRGFQTGYEIEHLNTRLLAHWFQERDRRLYYAMPYWLQAGLRECIEEARAERRKLDFREDDYERRKLRELMRSGDARSPRELVQTTSADYSDSTATLNTRNEGYAFVRFLLSPAGRKSKTTKTLLKDYIAALDHVLQQINAEEDENKEPAKKPETEEEEEAYYKARNERWKVREKEINERVFQLVFGSWDEGDWRRLETAYFREL